MSVMRAGDVTSTLDQVEGQPALLDGAGLAHVVVVQPDEVGVLARDVGQQDLVADERRRSPPVISSSK